jgi:TolB-like protein/Flp pilus assembly protein TadD
MGADEEGTLAQLKAHRRALVDPKIKEHHGKIIKTTGDGMLVEFPSAVDAVRCAVEVQRGMAERNAGVPPEKRIEFRLGINVGDIIHDNRGVFGDGVNVAARLEGLVEPGGICVSQGVRDPVRDKLGFTFEDMGEQALKNIAVPIHAFRVRFEGAEPAERAAVAFRPLRDRKGVVASVVGLAAVCAVAAFALATWPRRAPPPPSAQAVATAQSAPLPLPDKPSIAVLPFTNIGGDAKQERLAEGITEDVITDLSRFHEFFVIARNSVFTYKGKAVNVPEVGRELGVRYVLEGSIQTSGDRVRVTAQLIEAATNSHVWSERYERPLDDIFEVQNEVTQKIAAAVGGLTGAVVGAERAAARRKPPASLQAYDYYMLGVDLMHTQTKENFFRAAEFLNKAIELDPQLARAYMKLGTFYYNAAEEGWGPDDANALYQKAKAMLTKAIALDPNDSVAHARLGEVENELGDFDHGMAEFEKAVSMNPNDPDNLIMYAGWLPNVGRAKEGVEMVKHAFRLNPHYPDWYDQVIDPFYASGQYDEVIAKMRRRTGEPPLFAVMDLAMSYAQLGRRAEAEATAAELSRRFPDLSFERALSDFIGEFTDQPTFDQYRDGARKAGIRECATSEELQKHPKMTHLALCDAKRATN